MSTFLSIVGGLALFLALPVAAIWFIRAQSPHSKKMAHEQAQLDKKTGATKGALAPASTGGNGKGLLEGLKETFGPRIWTILLVLAGAAVFFWGLYTPGLRLSQVGDWSFDHWIWLLAFGGIIFTLIRMHASALGTMGTTLQSVLAWTAFFLFIGIPAGFWVKDIFLPQVICKDVSAHETRSCTLNTAWSTWIKFAEGPENNGMQICFTPGGKFERTDVNGTTFWRFKADEGRLVKAYRLFPGNKACPSTLS